MNAGFVELNADSLLFIEGGSWNGWAAITAGAGIAAGAIFAAATAPITVPVVAGTLIAGACGGAMMGIGVSDVAGLIQIK